MVSLSDLVEYATRDGVGVITLNNPPVNALGAGVRQGVANLVERARADGGVQAIVLTGAGRCFCGGADIREFGQPPIPPSLPEVIDIIESCPKPVVAALHGVAYGGGFELPLGCHFRIAAPSARVALPEVTLGLIPGAGGTQRLPRLIGVEATVGVILSGKPVVATSALSMGIVDEIVDGDLVDAAIAFALACADKEGPPTRVRDLEVAKPEPGFFEDGRKKIARRARGLIAPWHCIESIENTTKLPFDEGLKKERALFLECRESEQSKGQRHIFFAEREAAKIPDVPRDTPALAIQSVAVIGCGTMGAGIAMCVADAGIPVRILETDADVLEKWLARITKSCEGSVKRGRLSEAGKDACLGLIQGVTDIADIKDADIVIEAVFEDLDLKKEIFAKLDTVCRPGAILATNTSTLDVNEIAAVTNRAEQVIGTHFFSPADIMRLVEIVRGAETSAQTIATVMAMARRLKKVGVLV
ncbi:MAG TPA: 3-hydroxyacyl-CoA dehydrogenase, partial [Rhodospirillales bacterium]|nr:3-hydroxyacyl-CoA dehydrogenase [Rhodospirillales bacterium]